MEADERRQSREVDSDGFECSDSDSDSDSDSSLLGTRPLSEFATNEDGGKSAGTTRSPMRMNPLVALGTKGGNGGAGGGNDVGGGGGKATLPSLSIGGGGNTAGGSGSVAKEKEEMEKEKDVPRINVPASISTSSGGSADDADEAVRRGEEGGQKGGDKDAAPAPPPISPTPFAKPTLPAPAVPAIGKPALPKLTLGGGSGSGAGGGAGSLGSRKPPGLGLSLGGVGGVQSNSANPSPSGSAMSGTSSSGLPSPVVFGSRPGGGAGGGGGITGLSLGNRPVGLNLEALRDDVDQPLSELQIRREKFAFFEKHCTKIVEGIYVAGEGVARNRATLDEHGITHVINCNAFIIPNYFEPDLAYQTLWLQDTPNEDITCVLYDCFDFIRDALASGGRVLVHCSQGVSRSASVVISFLMWRDGDNYENTFRLVKEKRGIANPNMGFTCQMLQWNKRRKLEAEPGGAVHRLHRVAPHSQHDPRYLVAKPLSTHGADQLDARGTFVLQTASGKAYVWVGPSAALTPGSAEEEHTRRGLNFARQLQMYENLGGGGSGSGGGEAGGSRRGGEGGGGGGGGESGSGRGSAAADEGMIEVIKGGEEPPEVMEALGLSSERGGGWSGAAGAKIAAYDEDFAMYEKGERSSVAAKSGAAVPAPAWARALTTGGGSRAGGSGAGGGSDEAATPGKLRVSTEATAGGGGGGGAHRPGSLGGMLNQSNSTPPTPTGLGLGLLQSFPLAVDASGGSLSGASDVSTSSADSPASSLPRSSSLPADNSANDLLDGLLPSSSPAAAAAAAAPPRSPLGIKPPTNRFADLIGSPQSRPLSTDEDDDSDSESSDDDYNHDDDDARPPLPKSPKTSRATTAGASASGLALSGLGLGGGRGEGGKDAAMMMDATPTTAAAAAAAAAPPATTFAFSRPRPPSKPPHMPPPPRGMGGVGGGGGPAGGRRSNGADAADASGKLATSPVGGVGTAAGGSQGQHPGETKEKASTQRDGDEDEDEEKTRRRAPSLYEYPSLEPMGVYDVDDLDPQGVFILLVSVSKSGGGGVDASCALYVWIGADAGDGELNLGDDLDVAGGRIGEECVMKLGVVGGHDVHVEVEGSESSEFWEAFEEGT